MLQVVWILFYHFLPISISCDYRFKLQLLKEQDESENTIFFISLGSDSPVLVKDKILMVRTTIIQ
jgi:hypothetical protein